MYIIIYCIYADCTGLCWKSLLPYSGLIPDWFCSISSDYLRNISNLLMVKDYKAQNKLHMDKCFFQRLPVVLSTLHIPLQTPTVVGQKVYIPSTLIAFLHTTKIFVKALTLRFVMKKWQSVMWSFPFIQTIGLPNAIFSLFWFLQSRRFVSHVSQQVWGGNCLSWVISIRLFH